MNDPCRLCGGQLVPWHRGVLDPCTLESFDIAACASCGLGHTRPEPVDLARHYGDAYYGGRHGATAAYCTWRRLRWLERTAPRRGRLLDVGCGEGTFLEAAGQRGWLPVGTEMSEAARRARERGIDVLATLDEASARAPFQAVTLWHTLEHLRDPLGGARRLRRILAPDGVLLLAVPNARGLQAQLYGSRWFHLDVPRHLYHFGPQSLDRLLAMAGFRVLWRRHQEVEYDVFGWIQSALNDAGSPPNFFFERLTGARRNQTARFLAEGAAASLLGLAAIPATALGTLVGRGGTLVVAARPT
jgi:SAM-dependent methyltransferase